MWFSSGSGESQRNSLNRNCAVHLLKRAAWFLFASFWPTLYHTTLDSHANRVPIDHASSMRGALRINESRPGRSSTTSYKISIPGPIDDAAAVAEAIPMLDLLTGTEVSWFIQLFAMLSWAPSSPFPSSMKSRCPSYPARNIGCMRCKWLWRYRRSSIFLSDGAHE